MKKPGLLNCKIAKITRQIQSQLGESVLLEHPLDELPARRGQDPLPLLLLLWAEVGQAEFGRFAEGVAAIVVWHHDEGGHGGEAKVDVAGLLCSEQELAAV